VPPVAQSCEVLLLAKKTKKNFEEVNLGRSVHSRALLNELSSSVHALAVKSARFEVGVAVNSSALDARVVKSSFNEQSRLGSAAKPVNIAITRSLIELSPGLGFGEMTVSTS
jgi:16S rRNA C1402 N4-methylase RsmH